jgi:NAD(P)-dependent dehydrogenase (short-subunit alcohol dehydrogenase family)
VTGGARGIGRKGAEAFVAAGSNVIIADIDIDTAQKTAKELETTNSSVIAIRTDVTDPESVHAMVRQVLNRFSKIDILFNNAGICINEPAETMSFASWKRVIDINLTGVFLVAQEVGKVMIQQKHGSIINIASMSAHIVNTPQPQCGYNASKAGVIQLTKSLAVEWAPYHVRVNSISPGYIATEMTKKAPTDWKDEWIKKGVYKRMGNPEELQSALLYFASSASSFTTGSDLVIDGGFTCV